MTGLKGNFNGIIVCLFEILVGILLLIDPVAFTTGIISVAGIILLIVGVISIFKYFKSDAKLAALGQYLAKGLMALLAGLFCIFNSGWFIATFPVLTIIYGALVLVEGLVKTQLVVDMIRMKKKKWGFALVSAVLSIVCAYIILDNPFASVAALWMFTGIVLIAEAIIDIVTMIISGSKIQG